MLKKEIRAFYTLLLFVIFSSCERNTYTKSERYVKSNFHKYSSTYTTLNDSIQIYTDSLLVSFQSTYIWPWQIDSMVCINSKNDELVGIILSSSGIGEGMTGDDAEGLLGKKINGKWYFFKGGGTLIIPRAMYDKDEMHPLSFHELSQIARKELLESALIKNDKGEYVVDDKWIDAHFYNAGYYTIPHPKNPGMVSEGEEFRMPRDKALIDSVHWEIIMDKWKHKIDTNEYKPLKKIKVNS